MTDANMSRRAQLVYVLVNLGIMHGAVNDLEPVLNDAAGRGVSTRFCLRESDQTE